MPELNRTVKLSDVTADASITFSFERLERLEEYWPDGWFATVMDGMEPPRPTVIRKLLEIGLDGAEVDQVLRYMSVSEITRKIGDALFMALQGKTMDEIETENAKEAINVIRQR